jgi:hypothetical protein
MALPGIISISRRGDIPAFHTPWLMKRLREGYCYFHTPYGGKIQHVSLGPEDCEGLVFWTRNPYPLFKHIDELKDRGYYFYFHFTITGYPKPLESHTPPLLKSIDRFKYLSEKIGPDSVHWRYDPVVLSNLTPEAFHIDNFSFIADNLKGSSKICTISFLQFYKKSRANFTKINQQLGVRLEESAVERKIRMAQALRKIASDNGFKLRSCCDSSLLEAGISKGSCIGPEYLSLIRTDFHDNWKKRPTRKGCACIESVDIGTYETCTFGCCYCYATRGRETALKNLKNYHKNDPILVRSKRYMGVDLSSVNI